MEGKSGTSEDLKSISVFCDWLAQADPRAVRNIDELMDAISLQIASIDQYLVSLIRQVMRQPRFRSLESSFRSILALVRSNQNADPSITESQASRQVNVFVLDVAAEELREDFIANSHRQTWVYDKLFRKRFDLLIGEQNIDVEGYAAVHPFSLAIVDFDFSFPGITDSKTQIDLTSLKRLSRIGEDCFCMFLTSLAPSFFGPKLTSFTALETVLNVEEIVGHTRYQEWHKFRTLDESRMVGITMPRVLIRPPRRGYLMPETGILFDEFDGFPECHDFLWGSSAFAVAQPIIQSYRDFDWFSDVAGVDRDAATIHSDPFDSDMAYEGGLIRSLPRLSFGTDRSSVGNYSPLEITISESDEALLSSLGFIPVFSINQSPYVATLSSQTPQTSRSMSTTEASNNMRLSSLFNYMLCICRMAHRLKLECRSQIGKSGAVEEFQDQMQTWLMQFSSGHNRGLEQKMLKPFLDEGTGFDVEEDVTDPGRYDCRVRLCPHHKFDSGRTKIIFEAVSLNMELNADKDM